MNVTSKDGAEVKEPVPQELPPEVPRKSDEELREFVLAYCDGRVFTSLQISKDRDIGLVFMPLALGALHNVTDQYAASIGLIYEYLSKAGPSSINGMPVFFSCRLLHRDDCERVMPAIQRELDRRKNIEL